MEVFTTDLFDTWFGKLKDGPGYRIYYTVRARKLVILLAGADKSTRSSDVRAAQALANSL